MSGKSKVGSLILTRVICQSVLGQDDEPQVSQVGKAGTL